MSLGLGSAPLGLGPTSAPLAAFTPASVSPTAWYDPSDLSTLFQDSAGTTPVTASGDPVGRMNDKSGNGNHVIQATAAARPIYTVAGALKYLLFDGVDDKLAIATPWASISNATVSIAAREITRIASGLVQLSDGNGANSWGTLCVFTDGNIYFDCGGGAVPNRISAAAPFAAGTDFVVSLDNSVANSRQFIRVDKTQIASDASGETVTTAGNLGLGYNEVWGQANARVYGMVAKVGTAMTATELSNLETWLAAKQGRSI